MSIPNPGSPVIPAIRPYPWTNVQYTNITPFTLRDNATNISEIESIKAYLVNDVIPHLDGSFKALVEAWVKNVDELIDAVNANLDTQNAAVAAQLAAQDAEVTEQLTQQNAAIAAQLSAQNTQIQALTTKVLEDLAAAVEQVINATITVTDPIIVGVVNNIESNTRKLFESLFPRVYSVRTEAQIDNALTLIDAAGKGTIHVPADAIINITKTIVLPYAVSAVTVDGKIIATMNAPIFQRKGVYSGTNALATADAIVNDRVLLVGSNAGFNFRDWCFVASSDAHPRASDKLGYMRQVRSSDVAGQIGFDAPFYRAMTVANNLRAYKITMAPSIVFNGTGEIRYATQEGTSTMFSLWWIDGVTFAPGLKLRNGGSSAIGLIHCVNIDIHADIDEFRNDLDEGHVGYGVSLSGACRNWVIRGRISRCRHAITTVTGPSGAGTIVSFCGEPENGVMDAQTFFCSDKAVDSHVPGIGIWVNLNDHGSGGGVQVRADGVYVQGRGMGEYGPLLQVGPGPYTQEPIIGPLVGEMVRPPAGSGAISLSGNAKFLSFPQIGILGDTPLFKLFAPAVAKVAPDTEYRVKTTSQLNNNVALVDDLDLRRAFKPGAQVIVTGKLITSSPTAVDTDIKLDLPAGAIIYWNANNLPDTAATAISAVDRTALEANSVVTIGGISSNIRTATEVSALVILGATGGEIKLQFGQHTAGAGDTYMRRGSFLKFDQIL
jgi:hypothetical protein